MYQVASTTTVLVRPHRMSHVTTTPSPPAAGTLSGGTTDFTAISNRNWKPRKTAIFEACGAQYHNDNGREHILHEITSGEAVFSEHRRHHTLGQSSAVAGLKRMFAFSLEFDLGEPFENQRTMLGW